ncbi:MAG: hypothetical protein INR71_06600 [Terriglobus roseus]|nr:hypothetical protein [Terriglobus roseus]
MQSARSSPSFSRQLYMHALTYLLRATPTDLTAEEAISVGNALPQDVKSGIARQYAGSVEMVPRPAEGGGAEAPEDRSMLHRLVASAILQFFLVFNVLLPYVKVFLAAAYRYERRYRVSERAFSAGVGMADRMGKRGVELSQAVYALNDGKVGQSINGVVVYWVRGVTGGIHEGVGEGLTVVGAGQGVRAKRRSTVGEAREIT